MKKKEDSTLKMLRKEITDCRENEKCLNYLDSALIAEAEENYSIYK